MELEIYKKLARHLDNLPGGFPPTQSGVEQRILKRLFTPEEAELAVHLTLFPEEPRAIAGRTGLTPDEASRRLEKMAKKGLILSHTREPGITRYFAAQYIVGIWEFQVNNLDKELIQDMDEYHPFLHEEAWKFPQLRTIPVGRSVTPQLEVMPYEMAEELVRTHHKFAVGPCICRRSQSMVGKGCDRREESCLTIGAGAYYGLSIGISREIDLQETLDLLKYADEAGMVLQPSNAKDAFAICLCCGCCCGVLRSIKSHAKPAALTASPFFAVHDPDTCQNCGICVDRCQMDALKQEDETVRLNSDRCIGCGLCVSTCPTDSLSLARKQESEQPDVPEKFIDSAIKLGKARGKIK